MPAKTNLDRYRYISSLGSGGMATVVLAEDTVLGREVALKRMKVSDDARGLSRLRREALIGASVSHPNLVSIYDVVTSDDGDQVIVMEYVPGETLRDLLFRETRLPTGPALVILRGVSAALDAIHSQGIVHRDVKPANILLGSGDTVKLADLGIASVPDRTRITTDGALLGTFSYMAPEQLGGSPATSAADVYALSAVAFEVLSGRKAHAEDNPVALAHAISTQPPPDLRDYWADAPEAAAEVLTRGMSKDPDQRPRSASELTGRLNAALAPETTARHDYAPPPRHRRRASTAEEGLAVGAAGAAGMAAGQGAAEAAAKPEQAPVGASAAAPEARGADPAAARRRPSAAPVHRSPNRSRGALIAGGLISLVAVAVALTVILSGGANNPRPRSAGRAQASKPSAPPARSTSTVTSRTSTASSSATSTAAAAAGSTPAGAAGSPVSTVETFYHLAAAHSYSQAWALADPAAQAQLGGYQLFQSGQAGDHSITFNSAHVTSQSADTATVAIQTTSVRNDGTHQCSGTVDLARSGSTASWALHQLHINCT